MTALAVLALYSILVIIIAYYHHAVPLPSLSLHSSVPRPDFCTLPEVLCNWFRIYEQDSRSSARGYCAGNQRQFWSNWLTDDIEWYLAGHHGFGVVVVTQGIRIDAGISDSGIAVPWTNKARRTQRPPCCARCRISSYCSRRPQKRAPHDLTRVVCYFQLDCVVA
jgi:hypothetical protein